MRGLSCFLGPSGRITVPDRTTLDQKISTVFTLWQNEHWKPQLLELAGTEKRPEEIQEHLERTRNECVEGLDGFI